MGLSCAGEGLGGGVRGVWKKVGWVQGEKALIHNFKKKEAV